jgi:hypothetical protein
MSLKLTTEEEISDRDLLDAIALRCTKCFQALNIANSLGGVEDKGWRLVRTFSLVELLREADERKLDLSSIVTAVDHESLFESKLYKITRQQM